jgi:beta-lactamase class A
MKFNSILPGVLIVFLWACQPAGKTTSVKTSPDVMDTGTTTMADATVKNSPFPENLLAQFPQHFDSILKNKQNGVQIIYTKMDRGRNGNPRFTDYYYNVNADEYFYPASTIKFPIAVLALQKLNELNISGLNRNTTMITETAYEKQTAVYNDPTAADGRPTIGHYIKKILLVSDNDASNRLYEFLGQEYINNTLHKMGFTEVQIIHRLAVSMTEEQNRHTNPVKFYDANGKLIYEKPAERSNLVFEQRNTKRGVGFYRGEVLVNEPFDFSTKNKISLESLHRILKSIMFPGMVSSRQRFNLKPDDYRFLYKYMSMLPGESKYPNYDTAHYWDAYVKFILAGSEKEKMDPEIRIFNKVGEAYGYLIDVAYVADFKNNIEFMVTASISCNSDGIYNDDQYDYDSTGFPFFKHLGKIIYDYELKRERKVRPDLSGLKFSYWE